MAKQIYTLDLRPQFQPFIDEGYKMDGRYAVEDFVPHVNFDELTPGMHLYLFSDVKDTRSKHSLPFDLHEIEITHKYEDVVFYKFTNHPEITIQHAVQGGIGCEYAFFPYVVMVQKEINLTFMREELNGLIEIERV